MTPFDTTANQWSFPRPVRVILTPEQKHLKYVLDRYWWNVDNSPNSPEIPDQRMYLNAAHERGDLVIDPVTQRWTVSFVLPDPVKEGIEELIYEANLNRLAVFDVRNRVDALAARLWEGKSPAAAPAPISIGGVQVDIMSLIMQALPLVSQIDAVRKMPNGSPEQRKAIEAMIIAAIEMAAPMAGYDVKITKRKAPKTKKV